ncbi:hypothetical protein HZH66_007425 [Vespula vulgaris]|uniref:Carboxylesterase type B domain-containing protein n=1 Tax=Vespula vulgaris TaxID=7454 RepID=A0A834JXN7_VESVU|nr:hypothetical protein HZH66_007425 [Vespula vulgaris]
MANFHWLKPLGGAYTDWEQLKDGYLYQKMIADVVGDYFFICPSIHFAQLFADRGMKVYYYFFTQEISGGGNSVRSKFDELWKTMLISVCQAMLYKANSVSQRTSTNLWGEWMGVMHGDEIEYVFGNPLNMSLKYSDKERDLSLRMIKIFSQFSYDGPVFNFPTNNVTKYAGNLRDQDYPPLYY